jgi:hypothetical protein
MQLLAVVASSIVDDRTWVKATVLLLVVAPAIAAADPPESLHYVEGGALFGAAQPVIGWNVMATAAVGTRVEGPWWLRGSFGYGRTIDNLGGHGPNGGTHLVARGGAEGRWCESAREWLCGIAGVDLGVQHGTWSHTSYPMPDPVLDSATSLVIVPRVGVDTGSPTLRARFDLEADVALAGSDTAMGDRRTAGVELGLGMVYAW